MTIEHKDIPEIDLHEPKAVSTATSGDVYQADGVGSGSWSGLQNASKVDYARVVIVGNTTAQALTTAVDSTLHTASDYVAITASLLTEDINSGITFNANHDFVIATTGIYSLEGWASISTSLINNTIALAFAVNGVAQVVGKPVIKTKLKTSGDISPVAGFGLFNIPAGAVVSPVLADDSGATVTIHEGEFSIHLVSKS